MFLAGIYQLIHPWDSWAWKVYEFLLNFSFIGPFATYWLGLVYGLVTAWNKGFLWEKNNMIWTGGFIVYIVGAGFLTEFVASGIYGWIAEASTLSGNPYITPAYTGSDSDKPQQQ